ncbi:MAG: thermonuclease family protein, partial [Spirochaetota bacterium]
MLAAFFVVPQVAAAQAESEAIATGTVIEGTVVEVRDGDTVEVYVGAQTVPVRLHGIDSPESNQPYGERATRYTSELSLG